MTRHRHAPWGRRLLCAAGRGVIRGFQAFGAAIAGMPVSRFTADPDAVVAAVLGTRPAARARPLSEPPDGHPERVRPDLTPDDVERELWAQVRWPAGGSSPQP